MRNATTVTLSGILFLVGLGLISLSGHDHRSPALPSRIAEFYHDYNYICSFSTQAERKELVKHLDHGYLPEESKSRRLKEIFGLMKKVLSQVSFGDSDMVSPRKASMWIDVFRPEYYRIRNFNITGCKAAIGVSAYELQPYDVLRFISRYPDIKSVNTDSPALDQLLQETEKIICRKESHVWVLQNGKWKKRDGQFVYIKR